MFKAKLLQLHSLMSKLIVEVSNPNANGSSEEENSDVSNQEKEERERKRRTKRIHKICEINVTGKFLFLIFTEEEIFLRQ